MNSKQKGSQFEREICKKLSLWVSEGKRDDLYWRSAMSGGRATVRSKVGKQTINQLGDITAIDPLGFPLTDKFVIECKNYKSLGWESFVYGRGFIWEIWTILEIISDNNNRKPFLILKQNRKDVVVAFNKYTVGNIKDYLNIYPFLETAFMGFYYLDIVLKEDFEVFKQV